MASTTLQIPAGGQVSDLIALIKNATNIIESHYFESSLPTIPSLNSLDPHPLDSALLSVRMRDAIQLLEGACAQLCSTLVRPSHTIINRAMQFYEPVCLRVVVTFKIADILQGQPSGMHVKDMGERAGVNHEKLGRIMRLLATKHIFREVATDCFANNRLSLQLLSSNPMSNLLSFICGENNDATSKLVDVLADPDWGNSQEITRSAWNKLTGYKGSLCQFGTSPEGAKAGANFGIGIAAWNDAIQSAAVLVDFPWKMYPPGTTVNDVGGGVGLMAMELIKAFPNLQIKLQDLPDRIVQAKTEVWPRLLPSAVAEKRIEFKAMDFFVESPIAGCDVYYLKNIIHDWPDEACVQILRNIHTVLKPGARVLVHEYVLEHVNRTNTSNYVFTEAPAPILPNFGVGRIRQYNMDLGMMVLQNGKERTLEDLIVIGNKANLQFIKLWHVGEMGVVEYQQA